jgi:hypothetical protein
MKRPGHLAGLFRLRGNSVRGYLSAIYPHQKIGISPSIEIDVVLYDLLEFLFSIFFTRSIKELGSRAGRSIVFVVRAWVVEERKGC